MATATAQSPFSGHPRGSSSSSSARQNSVRQQLFSADGPSPAKPQQQHHQQQQQEHEKEQAQPPMQQNDVVAATSPARSIPQQQPTTSMNNNAAAADMQHVAGDSAVARFVTSFAFKHFQCPACKSLLVDPVQTSSIVTQPSVVTSEVLVCRGCISSNPAYQLYQKEAAASVVAAVNELRELCVSCFDATSTAGNASAENNNDSSGVAQPPPHDSANSPQGKESNATNDQQQQQQQAPVWGSDGTTYTRHSNLKHLMKVKRPKAATTTASAAAHQQQRQQQNGETASTDVSPDKQAVAASNGSSPAAGVGGAATDTVESVAKSFQGVSLNPNVNSNHPASALGSTPPGKQHPPLHFGSPSPSSNANNNNNATSPAAAVLLPVVFAELFEAEAKRRSEGTMEQNMCFMDFHKKRSAHLRALKANRRGSSRQLKIDADDKYEHAEYQASLELYTKAIDANDGTTKITVLHGNRSAANFMAQRYAECIADVMVVVKEDTRNVKMYQRAVKAAVNMGDLARAVAIYKMIDESNKNKSDAASASLFTDQMREEQDRLTKGAALLAHLTSGAAPVGADTEEHWRMLVAEFSDAVPLRLRYADYYTKQQLFEKAMDVLSRIVGPTRTPAVVRALAYNMYRTGFEFFGKAKEILQHETSDADCAALFAIISQVDDAKMKGNSLFSRRQFAESVEEYTKAITVDGSNDRILRILYCNRAAAQKELGNFKEGISDCTKAIQLDAAFSKAYARRARCHQHLGDYDNAVKDFKSASKNDPSDMELVRELRAAEQALARESEREKDHYYVLGVQRGATEKEIKVKYRELSLKLHPDKCVNLSADERTVAEKKFKLISEAYSVLTDHQKRREYDIKLDRERFMRSHHHPHHGAGGSGSSSSYFDPAGSTGFFTRQGGYGMHRSNTFTHQQTRRGGTSSQDFW